VDNVVRIFAYDGTLLKEINKGSPTLLKLRFFCLWFVLLLENDYYFTYCLRMQ
jgi:hypothetical protein